MKPFEVKIAYHRPSWGHCESCNNWSYLLNTYNGVCPICSDKDNAKDLQTSDNTAQDIRVFFRTLERN